MKSNIPTPPLHLSSNSHCPAPPPLIKHPHPAPPPLIKQPLPRPSTSHQTATAPPLHLSSNNHCPAPPPLIKQPLPRPSTSHQTATAPPLHLSSNSHCPAPPPLIKCPPPPPSTSHPMLTPRRPRRSPGWWQSSVRPQLHCISRCSTSPQLLWLPGHHSLTSTPNDERGGVIPEVEIAVGHRSISERFLK